MAVEEEVAVTGPLAGIRVLDVSTILAGPLACQILGDFGAEVIKIEHPSRGDGMRGHGLERNGQGIWWKMVSRNKRAIGLYLGDPDAAAIFRQLAATADVIVENFRPGTMEKWGLGYETLSAESPGLIMLRVSGFGQDGPYRERPAFGTLVEAMSGFAALTGVPDGPPTLPPFGLADSIAGIAGASAVSMALYHRDARDGEGQEIDLDLLLPIMTAVGPAVMYADQLGVNLLRNGNRSVNNAPRNTYLTADGHWVAVSTSADDVARRVMELTGHPEVVSELWFQTGRERADHADELDEMVGDWIGDRGREEVLTAFELAGAAIGPVYSPLDLLVDPQIEAMDMITTVDDPDLGPMRMQNVLWRMGGSPGSIRFSGRGLGADTEAVLLDELHVDRSRYESLKERGVIA